MWLQEGFVLSIILIDLSIQVDGYIDTNYGDPRALTLIINDPLEGQVNVSLIDLLGTNFIVRGGKYKWIDTIYDIRK